MIKAGDDEYVLYDIGKHENRYCITKVDKPIKDCIFKGDLCYRKARRPKPCQNWEEKGLFTDSNFPFKLEVTDKDSKG